MQASQFIHGVRKNIVRIARTRIPLEFNEGRLGVSAILALAVQQGTLHSYMSTIQVMSDFCHSLTFYGADAN